MCIHFTLYAKINIPDTLNANVEEMGEREQEEIMNGDSHNVKAVKTVERTSQHSES